MQYGFILSANSDFASLRIHTHYEQRQRDICCNQTCRSSTDGRSDSYGGYGNWRSSWESRRWARFNLVFSCWTESLDIVFYPEGDLRLTFLDGIIKIYIPRDVAKEITERVPVCTLITERYSISRRLLAGGEVEGDVNRRYCVIRVAKSKRSATRVRDGGKTDQEGKRYR